MTYNLSDVRMIDVPKDNVMVFWLGASGFVFKFDNGKIVCIDPYLSDYVERMFGFRRLTIPPISADKINFDYLLITHEHGDHLDVDSFSDMMAANPDCEVLAPVSCEGFLRDESANYSIIRAGSVIDTNGMKIITVDADHGPECPDAVGFVLEFGKKKIYFTGDTCFNKDMMGEIIASKPEIVIPCINGAYGNINDDEAALLAAECDAKVIIPSHFWLFAEHGTGSPSTLLDNINKKSPDTEVILLTPGRGVLI